MLFYLCYHVHPFEDSAKLRILNVAYSIPSGFDDFADVLPVIGQSLSLAVFFELLRFLGRRVAFLI